MINEIVSFEPLSAGEQMWTLLVSVRTLAFDDRLRAPSVTAVRLVCIGLAVVFPEPNVVPLVEGMSAVEWFVSVGLLPEYVLAFVLGWKYTSKRDARVFATSSGRLSRDVTFSVLKNPRRRETLRYLRRAGGKTSLSNLAEHVAAKENGVETHQLTSTQRKRVYVNLYQYHLPMMDDQGVIEYEQRRGSVELLDAASELFEYLDDTTGANGER